MGEGRGGKKCGLLGGEGTYIVGAPGSQSDFLTYPPVFDLQENEKSMQVWLHGMAQMA